MCAPASQAQRAPLPLIPIPGTATIAPGEGAILAVPGPRPVTRSAGGGQQFGLNPAPLIVQNGTDAPLTISISADETGVVFTGAAGRTLQIMQHLVAVDPDDPTSPPQEIVPVLNTITIDESIENTHLAGCAAAPPDGSTIACGGSPIRRIGDALEITVSDVPASETPRGGDLTPYSWLTLSEPQTDGSYLSQTVADLSQEQVHVDGDGESVTATVPDGFVATGHLRSVERDTLPRPLAVEAGCMAEDVTLSCPDSVLPSQGVLEVQAALRLPATPIATTLELPADTESLQMQTVGADPAPGGVAVTATLSMDGVTLLGSGALRPWLDSGNVQVLLVFARDDGSNIGLEGVLRPEGDLWSGSGYLLDTAAARPETTWTSGDPAVVAGIPFDFQDTPLFAFIEPTDAERQPIPLIPLANQIDPARTGPAQRGHAAPVPTEGKAGESLQFWVEASFPLYGNEAAATYIVDFGDGSPPQTVGAFSGPFDGLDPRRLNVSESTPLDHRYAAPGYYTIVYYRDDGTGAPMFGATVIRIAAPAGG